MPIGLLLFAGFCKSLGQCLMDSPQSRIDACGGQQRQLHGLRVFHSLFTFGEEQPIDMVTPQASQLLKCRDGFFPSACLEVRISQ